MTDRFVESICWNLTETRNLRIALIEFSSWTPICEVYLFRIKINEHLTGRSVWLFLRLTRKMFLCSHFVDVDTSLLMVTAEIFFLFNLRNNLTQRSVALQGWLRGENESALFWGHGYWNHSKCQTLVSKRDFCCNIILDWEGEWAILLNLIMV